MQFTTERPARRMVLTVAALADYGYLIADGDHDGLVVQSSAAGKRLYELEDDVRADLAAGCLKGWHRMPRPQWGFVAWRQAGGVA